MIFYVLLCIGDSRFQLWVVGGKFKVTQDEQRCPRLTVGLASYERGISKCSDKYDECHINVSLAKMPLGQMLCHDNGGGISQPANYFLIVPSPQNL